MSGNAPPPRAGADEESDDDYEEEEEEEEEDGPGVGRRVKDQPTMLDLMTGKYNMEEDDDDY